MRPTDSKISDLLPRIVERAARRSDEKEEEPWVKVRNDAPAHSARPSAALPAGCSAALLAFVFLPGLLAFTATGLVGNADYALAESKLGEQLRCIGAPIVHTVQFIDRRADSQFFAGALLVNALVWIGVTAAIWWCLLVTSHWLLDYWQSGKRRQFTLRKLLAISVGIAMTLAAWRWDLAAAAPWHSTLAAAQKAFEQGVPAGPTIQPLMRFSFLAAGYAYLGVGCAGLCVVSGGLWIIRQFLPRRPGEDKSLLQQIF